MRYAKTTEQKVFAILIETNLDFMNPIDGIINIVNLASLIGTSKYQVKKHINTLKAKGLVELRCVAIQSDEETYPPYWGYGLTEAATKTEEFIEAKKKDDKWFKEWFKVE